jgi:hypothetical protein
MWFLTDTQESKMINRLSNMVCWLVLVMAFVVAGCKQEYKPDESDVLAYVPDVNAIVVTDNHTPRTIKATGGYQAWMETIKMELDSVVTFYNPDGSFYLTEQHYEIYPWSNSIRISATEPQGKFVWLLSEGRFKVLEGAERFCSLPALLENRYFAEAILDMTTAPVRFLDKSVEFTRLSSPVKMEGLWYYPIERVTSDGEPDLYKVVFYQNKDSSLVDIIRFVSVDGEKSLAVRGYDYRKVEKKQVLVPTKIEIFRIDAKGVLQERLVKIDFN